MPNVCDLFVNGGAWTSQIYSNDTKVYSKLSRLNVAAIEN